MAQAADLCFPGSLPHTQADSLCRLPGSRKAPKESWNTQSVCMQLNHAVKL